MSRDTDEFKPPTPEKRDPFPNGVPRRRLLQTSVAVGATASAAGCVDDLTDDGEGIASAVFVFNTGEGTVSIIDADAQELVTNQFLGATSSWPANQFVIANPDIKTLWMNVEGGVAGFDPDNLEEAADVQTGSDKNWQEVTPDGAHLLVGVREPEHKYVRVDADPASDSFGEITGEIPRDGDAPCDMTIGADGEYAYVPDRAADRLTVLQVDPFEIAAEVDLDPVKDVETVRPYMCTASWDGEYLALENQEGEDNTESIFDISDPEAPTEITRLTQDDGIGRSPVSSEFSAASDRLYLFTVDSESITVVDLDGPSVTGEIELAGQSWTGSWDPDRETLYASIVDEDRVVAIEDESQEITTEFEVGRAPRGVTARREVNPPVNGAGEMQASLAGLGIGFDGMTETYCDGTCHCGTGTADDNHDHAGSH